MTNQRDPNSKRSKKRAKRDFAPSRPERRAEKRLAVATGAYNVGVKLSSNGGREFTAPGAVKHW